MGFTARFAFPTYAPRRYVTCGYQDNLGFGFNTALGVKVAHPDKAVVSVSGDGGFMYGAQELATAIKHRINIVAIVFNNSAFGNVLRDQKQSYGGRYIGSELKNPDFVKFGQSFGVRSFRAAKSYRVEEHSRGSADARGARADRSSDRDGFRDHPWPFLHPAPHAS